MHRPRIGIPLCLDDRERWREGRQYLYSDRRYADAIDRAGGLAFHLPIQSDPNTLATQLDGLLLPGGDDFPSDRPLPSDVRLDLVPEAQRTFDEALYRAARVRGLPILGICYGMQLMVLARGGVLEPHLPSREAPVAEHRLPASERHPIRIEAPSRLHSIFETEVSQVNSLHHQAVQDPGPDYRVVARAEDGVIEAVEAADAKGGAAQWEIGVQWHPEKMLEGESDPLFEAFVDACRNHIAGTPDLKESAGSVR